MPNMSGLDGLLKAIHNSVLEAQKLTEEQHLKQLKRYFNDEDGSPVCQKFQIPDTDPKSPNQWRTIEVPLLCMLPLSSIKIKEMSMEFKIMLGEIPQEDEDDDEILPALDGAKKKKSKPLLINLKKSLIGDQGTMADVKIVFEGTEPPESFLRINDHLINAIP